MKKILLVFAILLFSISSCAQTWHTNDSFIEGWRLEFWQLKPLTGSYLVVFPSDTLTIQFDQELKSVPYSQQQRWGIGDTTGVCDSIFVTRESLNKINVSDSIATYQVLKKVILLPGAWALVIRTKGTNGQYSRHSKPFWFSVVSLPPNMPVEIKLWVKP